MGWFERFKESSTELGIATCRRELALMEHIHRCEIYNHLAIERLTEKSEALNLLFEESLRDWNQTLYLMLFRTIGDLQNRELFLEIGRRTSYHMVQRERPSQLRIEAILFGTASLLGGCRDDDYTRQLKAEFEHLSQKYSIEPIDPKAWRINRLRPANHPRLRLAQIATFLNRQEFVIDKVLECRERADVERLFSIEASQYWSSYYNPSQSTSHTTKRLGEEKSNMIGINLVAVMQFLYGKLSGQEDMMRRAIDLWERLSAEHNRYTKPWESDGVVTLNAFESQALLQLSRKYCDHKLCAKCPLGRRLLKK